MQNAVKTLTPECGIANSSRPDGHKQEGFHPWVKFSTRVTSHKVPTSDHV